MRILAILIALPLLMACAEIEKGLETVDKATDEAVRRGADVTCALSIPLRIENYKELNDRRIVPLDCNLDGEPDFPVSVLDG